MQDFFSGFVSSNSFDEFLTIGVMLIIISVGFWVLIGRFRLHNALINFYISFAIVQVIPEVWMSFSNFSGIIFFAILVIFFTLIDRSLFDIHLPGSGLAIWQVIVLSILEAGLLVSLVINLVPDKIISPYFTERTFGYFSSPGAGLFWMVIPLLFLIYIDKKSG